MSKVTKIWYWFKAFVYFSLFPEGSPLGLMLLVMSICLGLLLYFRIL